MLGRLAALIVIALAVGTPAAADDWTARKCTLYHAAWDKAASGVALDGVRPEFLRKHDTFLESDCMIRAVCPRTDAEFALADTLSLMAVAEGMAGSFLPFSCGGGD